MLRMPNHFSDIERMFDDQRVKSRADRLHGLHYLLQKFGIDLELVHRPNKERDMSTVEQRMNLYHLLHGVLLQQVPGDVVEFGSYVGHTASLFQRVISDDAQGKQLHLFDDFRSFREQVDPLQQLLARFKKYDLPDPVIHQGQFSQTVPAQLPASICFAHLDCGVGGRNKDLHDTILFLLENIYERLSPGGVVVLMDYHDPARTVRGFDVYPGVKVACDRFLADRPEKMTTLYGNHYSHAYFQKPLEHASAMKNLRRSA